MSIKEFSLNESFIEDVEPNNIEPKDETSDQSIAKNNDENNDENKIIVESKPTVNRSGSRLTIRKKQLFDVLSSNKLTYVKGGICDSFIKFGVPSLDTVVSNVRAETELEDERLLQILDELKKRDLIYDSRVSYYREYVEQGTDLKTAIERGKKEWFYLNKTKFPKLLRLHRDEDLAMCLALNQYISKNGIDADIKKYIGIDAISEIQIY